MSVAWVKVADARRVQFTPVGLQLVDDFTGQPPAGRVQVILEAQHGAVWHRLDHAPTFTLGGWIAFLGLGKTIHPLGKPVVRHRVQLEAIDLLPLYGTTLATEHVEFDVTPFDDANPPTTPVDQQKIFLLPAATYAFPSEVMVARGQVVDGSARPVPRALVTYGNEERALTDARGQFSLPLRWAPRNTTVQIDAADAAGRLGSTTVAVPGGLRRALEILIA